MQRKKYFPMFDILRFAGCLLIFLYHYDGVCGFGLALNNSKTLDFIIRNGNEAITLFFMISGFCMASRYRDRIRERSVHFSAFAWKQYAKFLSMTLVTLPITIVKAICMYKAGMDTMPNLFGFVLDILGIRTGYSIHTFFGYNGPLWFINVLFLMYVFYYWIVYITPGKTECNVICMIIVLFSISQRAIATIGVFVFNTNTYLGFSGFFIGVLLYEVYEYYCDAPIAIKRINILGTICMILVSMAIYLNLHFPGIGVLPENSNLWANYSIVLTLVFWPCIIFLMSQIGLNERVQRIAGLLSKLSTSIYIWHWPVIYILYSLTLMGKVVWRMGSGICTLLVCGLTLGTSLISALYLEERVHRGIIKFFRKA